MSRSYVNDLPRKADGTRDFGGIPAIMEAAQVRAGMQPGAIVDYHRGTIVPYTHNGFQFNENGVCLNPRVVARHHGKKIQWQLSIAQAITDEWCNAINLDYVKTAIQGGMGEPCSRATYSSDTQALEAGLERVWRLLHDLLISLHDCFEPPRPDDIKAVLAAMGDAKEPRDLQPYRDQWDEMAKRAEKRLGYRPDYPLDRGRIVPKPANPQPERQAAPQPEAATQLALFA